MNRKFIVFIFMLTYILSLSIGLFSHPVTESNTVQTPPIAVASTGSSEPIPLPPVKPFPGGPKGGGATTNGGSWGG